MVPECFHLPGWGSLCHCCYGKPGEKACCRYTKAPYCLWAEDVPPAFPDPLSIFFLLVAGCMKLTCRDCINKLTLPAAIHWVGTMRAPARSEGGGQWGKSIASFSSSGWRSCRGWPPLCSFQLREADLTPQFPCSLRSSNVSPSSSFGPKMSTSASLALSNFTVPPCGFSTPFGNKSLIKLYSEYPGMSMSSLSYQDPDCVYSTLCSSKTFEKQMPRQNSYV